MMHKERISRTDKPPQKEEQGGQDLKPALNPLALPYVEQYYEALHPAADRTLGYMNCLPHLRDDIYQTSWLKVLTKIESFDAQKGEFQAWFMRILKNTFIDLQRRHAAPGGGMGNSDVLKYVIDPARTTEEEAIRHIVRDAVHEKVESLPKHQSNVLIANFFKGQTQREIAESSNTPVGTIKSWQRKALKTLREECPDFH